MQTLKQNGVPTFTGNPRIPVKQHIKTIVYSEPTASQAHFSSQNGFTIAQVKDVLIAAILINTNEFAEEFLEERSLSNFLSLIKNILHKDSQQDEPVLSLLPKEFDLTLLEDHKSLYALAGSKNFTYPCTTEYQIDELKTGQEVSITGYAVNFMNGKGLEFEKKQYSTKQFLRYSFDPDLNGEGWLLFKYN